MIGRFGDFVINVLLCFCALPRLELDVAAVSGSGSVSFHDSRRLACRVILRPHRSRSLLRLDTRVRVLLALLGDLLHHRLSSTSASVGSRRLT